MIFFKVRNQLFGCPGNRVPVAMYPENRR